MPLFGPPNIEKLRAKGDVPGLVKALSHKDQHTRLQAAQVFKHLRDPRAVDALVEALARDPNHEMRKAAAAALGALGDERAVGALQVALESRDSDLRGIAAGALRGILTPEAVDALAREGELKALSEILLDRAGDGGKLAAARALASLGDPRALQPLLESDSGLWIDEAVRNLGEAAVDPLIDALGEGKADVRTRAAAALGKVSALRAIDALLAALNDHHKDVRLNAIGALAQYAAALSQAGDMRPVEPLISALRHDDAKIRLEAARALGKLRDPRAIEPLIGVLQGDADSSVRAAVAGILGELGDPRAIKPLIATLKKGANASADPIYPPRHPEEIEVGWAAKDALMSFDKPGADALTAAIDREENAEVRAKLGNWLGGWLRDADKRVP